MVVNANQFESFTDQLKCLGLADLTGGVTESISIKDPTRLSEILNKLLMMTSIVTSVVQTETPSDRSTRYTCDRLANGIAMSINYRVMAVEKVETINGDIVQLVRLRNPSGLSNNFIGSWNKDSIEWKSVSDDTKDKLNIKYNIEGEFWMTYNEFVKVFTTLEVIHLDLETSKDEPSLRGRQPWHLRFMRGSWKRGKTRFFQ